MVCLDVEVERSSRSLLQPIMIPALNQLGWVDLAAAMLEMCRKDGVLEWNYFEAVIASQNKASCKDNQSTISTLIFCKCP
jgi:hypothetical protein